MEFEIMENVRPVTFDVPSVSFPAYEAYKERAMDIADQIQNMEVDPENIREAKDTLAEARKITQRLDRARIDIKKEILTNYALFETQVKEISAIIGDADGILRSKVRALENAEREMKKRILRDIWDKRIKCYPNIAELMPSAFDRWLTPQHLNKTVAIKKAEDDMVRWMDQTNKDLTSAKAISGECLVQYLTCGNLAEAIKGAALIKEYEKKIENLDREDQEEKAIFLIRGAKNIKFVEMLLKENEVEFERK